MSQVHGVHWDRDGPRVQRPPLDDHPLPQKFYGWHCHGVELDLHPDSALRVRPLRRCPLPPDSDFNGCDPRSRSHPPLPRLLVGGPRLAWKTESDGLHLESGRPPLVRLMVHRLPLPLRPVFEFHADGAKPDHARFLPRLLPLFRFSGFESDGAHPKSVSLYQ